MTVLDNPMADIDEEDDPPVGINTESLSEEALAIINGGPFYETLEEFVRGFFSPMFARQQSKIHWCRYWFLHEEAVMRLKAIWFAFEDCRRKPGVGQIEWLRHVEPQLGVLFGPDGPFGGCTHERHILPPALALAETPDGWWAMAAEQQQKIRQDEKRWK